MKIISRLYRHPKNFLNWLKNRREEHMETTIDNITMQRITLDVDDVKNAIKHYVASYVQPKIQNIDNAIVSLHSHGALVEIILDSVPDMPDTAPPCIETPSNGVTGPIHPEKMMEHLQKSFVPEPDKED